MVGHESIGGVVRDNKGFAVRAGAVLLSVGALTGCGTERIQQAAHEQPETVTVTVPASEAPVLEAAPVPESAAPTQSITKTKSPTFIKKSSRPAHCYLEDAATVMCSAERAGVYYLNGTDADTADDSVDVKAGEAFILQVTGAITLECGGVTVAYAKDETATAHPFFKENVCR